MPKAKSRSPARKPQKSSSLPQLKKTYYTPLHLCSVNIAKHSYSVTDVRLGFVEKGKPQRLPFMHVDRADDRSETVPKLPSLRKIMNSIQRMKLDEPGKSSLTTQSMTTLSPKSGSLRVNPLFGGSPPYRGGPRLPIKRKRSVPGALAKVKLPRSRPTSSSGKKGKRAAWAKETETQFVEYNEFEEEDSPEEEAPESPKSDDDSSSDSSSFDSSSGSSWSDSSDEHDPPPPSALRGRSTGMTRRMSAFAMMLPLLDSNNQPVRRASVAEVFLKALEENKVEDNKPGDVLDFPWSDEECRSVFIKFDTDTDGEVATEDLEIMLKYMGCILRKGEVDKLVQEMFSYATVSWEEWMTFLEKYREVDEQYLRDEFNAADGDGNGVLDVDELNELLKKMGYITDSHTVMEAMETIGCASKGTVDLRRFEKMREHLRCTEGLARADVKQLRALYDRVSHTAKAQQRCRKLDLGAGSQQDIAKKLIAEQQEMPVEDVWRVVQYLGYKTTWERVEHVSREVDNDSSGYISFQELLKLIRRIRDAEREAIASIFEVLAEDGTRLHLKDLTHACAELKYFLTDDMVNYCLRLLRLKSTDCVSQDEIVAFLNLYRDKDGLTPQERRELEEVFEQQCKVTSQRQFLQQLEDHAVPPKTSSPKGSASGSMLMIPASPPKPANHTSPRPTGIPNLDVIKVEHAVDALRASRVMRWFGVAKPLPQVQAILEEMDLDAKGKLEVVEFSKLMNRLFSEMREQQWTLFTMLDNKGNDTVMVSKLPFAVQKLAGPHGGSIAKAEKAANKCGFTLMDTKASIPREKFNLFFKHFRILELEEMREHACYSPSEVIAMQDVFNKFDKDRSGTVERRELAKIIAEYFPEATKSREGRAEMQLILKDVDVDGNGALDFLEFLVLMRRCDDIRDESDIQLEETVAVALGIGPDELEGFRQIFASKANWVGELSPEAVMEILGYITELSEDDAQGLNAIIREVHPEHKLIMRFPQFLQVMKRLTEQNHGNINHHCERVIKKSQQRASVLI